MKHQKGDVQSASHAKMLFTLFTVFLKIGAFTFGGGYGLSRKKDVPSFLRSKYFRYGFLIFFLAMFFVMIFNIYLVFSGAGSLSEKVTLLWTFKLPWDWAYGGGFIPWTAQFAFGFYSIMLTSTILGFITMLLFKPRSWCVYCPMGTMTQLICKVKNK